VLTAGVTPHTALDSWTFALEDEDHTKIASWGWEEFRLLGPNEVTVDIHCVTRWSKLDTTWRGVTVDRIFEAAGLQEPPAPFVMAFCDGGYTTNLPLADVTAGKAWVAFDYDGAPLPPEHGGPARLLVPHLYFWKSAKWVRGLRLRTHNEPGFWEQLGYHDRGDPWREQRYQGDP
jgi:DMSO/TMAO reductase YedYZ molybdopterin-dependent catalytic subunit